MPSLLFIIIATSGLLVHVLPLDTSVTATTEGRLVGEVDVLLRVEANQKAAKVKVWLAIKLPIFLGLTNSIGDTF